MGFPVWVNFNGYASGDSVTLAETTFVLATLSQSVLRATFSCWVLKHSETLEYGTESIDLYYDSLTGILITYSSAVSYDDGAGGLADYDKSDSLTLSDSGIFRLHPPFGWTHYLLLTLVFIELEFLVVLVVRRRPGLRSLMSHSSA
jgi:hypothetical protein